MSALYGNEPNGHANKAADTNPDRTRVTIAKVTSGNSGNTVYEIRDLSINDSKDVGNVFSFSSLTEDHECKFISRIFNFLNFSVHFRAKPLLLQISPKRWPQD